MHIRKDDTVVVITGKDKGKKGKVIKAMPKENEIKHQEGPIDVSNVMFYDSKAKAPTRIGYVIEDGKKYRVSKKTGEKLD